MVIVISSLNSKIRLDLVKVFDVSYMDTKIRFTVNLNLTRHSPQKIMSTNNRKRAYEEVSEDDQYFIDRVLEIKARVEKYYDNHPEEYKILLI